LEPGYAWAIPDTETDEMKQSIYDSIMKTLEDVPVSFFCLQNKYYSILTAEQLKNLSLRLRGINTIYPTFPPQLTTSPTPIPIIGDVDQNNKIEMLDYYYFIRAAYSGMLPMGMNADVNKDGQVNDQDRNIIIKKINK